MAQAANAAHLRRQQAMRAGIEASRSSSQGEVDSNSNQNSNQSFIITEHVSPYQQELLRGQQTHPAYWGQQASPDAPRSQGNQRQQGQRPSGQQSPPYYWVQQYARQPTTNASSYPSNTSRRTHKQPPKPSRPTPDQGMTTSINQQAPQFQFSSTSSQVPDDRNFITDSSHSHPARSPQNLPPSKNPAMATIASTFASGSSSASAPFPPQQNGPPWSMYPFNTFNPTTSEQPPAFIPHSPLIAPPQWKHARSVNYGQEVLPQNPRERWANGLLPTEIPPDTSDSPEAASGAVQGPGGWKAPNAPGQLHWQPQVSSSRNAGSQLSMASIAPPSSRASGAGYASANQAREPPFGAYVGDIRPPSAKIQRLQDGSRHAVNPPNGASKFSRYVHRSPSPAHLKTRCGLVQPIDVRDAALKESYDPATIARDVLINADKHPTEPILNHHLEILSQNIPSINIASDLESIRWDLIDPVSSRDTAIHRSPARVESRPSKDLGVPPFVPPSYQAWQSQFPPSPAPATAFARPALRPPSQSPPPPSPSAQFPYPAPLPVFTRPSTSKPSSAPITTPTPVLQPTAELPLGPKLSPAPAPAPAPARPIQPQTPSSSGLRRASESSWSKEPSRSRQHSPHTQVQVVIPPSPHRMPPRKKGQVGRPKKTAEATHNVEVAIQREPTVPYPIYHCKWIDCLAELHNLQALQSHVLKIHIPHNLHCGWKECADRTPRAAADMWEHVTKQHIEKVGWTLGDGPVVPVSGENDLATIDISARDSHL
ncbi:uncharacterized protein N7498_007995 [Penicillium cinerascens]|uniref:C2H2-type domain-containing protein n=1 Tax=Penicillium cinerascens TaxID=70096 RepID=A0A9W9MBU2_9EURO|nr:uncharacterized protein N7498_007995 [Penicillium cinerascens]KAJ5194557.1 hypothetical protein N7498_007995 [Penicillium cinerascens]